MMKRRIFFVGLATVALAGCQRLVPRPAVPPRAAPAPAAAVSPQATIQPEAKPSPGVRSSYQPFTAAAYTEAKAAGRPIMLYFYANWCPLCRPQEPVNVAVFGEGTVSPLGIAGFRVNYNDDETDDDERALARQFGVNYQHTFVTFGSDGTEIWRTTGTQNREQLMSRLQTLR